MSSHATCAAVQEVPMLAQRKGDKVTVPIVAFWKKKQLFFVPLYFYIWAHGYNGLLLS